MRKQHCWPGISSHLDPPTTRSLSLLFILQEWVSCFQQMHSLNPPSPETPAAASDSFIPTEESLDKLCFYSSILIQASKMDDSSPLTLLEEMRHLLSIFRVKVIACKENFAANFSASFLGTLQMLQQKLRDFFYALIPFLRETRTDENVLIYLIEQKKAFNQFLKPAMIEHLLQQFFPSGPSHLRAVICEGLTRRGFSSFLAAKEPLIEELEWPITPSSP